MTECSVCHSCGHRNEQEANFCEECGAPGFHFKEQASPEPLKAPTMGIPKPSREEELERELARRKERCWLLAGHAFEIAKELGRKTEEKPPDRYFDDSHELNNGFLHTDLLGGYELKSDLLNILGFGVHTFIELTPEYIRENEDLVREMGSRHFTHSYVNVLSDGKQVLSTWAYDEDLYLPGKWEDSLATLLSSARDHYRNMEAQVIAEKERSAAELANREKRRFGLLSGSYSNENLKVKCAVCGYEVSSDAQFCEECGSRLADRGMEEQAKAPLHPESVAAP